MFAHHPAQQLQAPINPLEQVVHAGQVLVLVVYQQGDQTGALHVGQLVHLQAAGHMTGTRQGQWRQRQRLVQMYSRAGTYRWYGTHAPVEADCSKARASKAKERLLAEKQQASAAANAAPLLLSKQGEAQSLSHLLLYEFMLRHLCDLWLR